MKVQEKERFRTGSYASVPCICRAVARCLTGSVATHIFFSCINTESIPVRQSQNNNFLTNIQLTKVTVSVLQCISEKPGCLSCDEKPDCTVCCATMSYFRMLLLIRAPMPKALQKIQGRWRKKVIVFFSAILKRTEKTYSFWKKSKYWTRFGHPELMRLLTSLPAGSLAGSPVQWTL